METPARTKRERAMQYARRGFADLETWANANGLALNPASLQESSA
jgi:hypothetical protein